MTTLSFQETKNHEVKTLKIISLYLPIILNLFLQENQTILFLDDKSSQTVDLDQDLMKCLETNNDSNQNFMKSQID